MAIKKRSKLPSGEQPSENVATPTAPLHIEAKPKAPMPSGGVLSGVYGAAAPAPAIRRAVLLAASLGHSTARTGYTIEDYVTALRTPYDVNNLQELRYRARVRNRATAITAMCIVCTGTRKGVTECASTKCPLWAFRFGTDPFFGNR
jgi:hypothetical protein